MTLESLAALELSVSLDAYILTGSCSRRCHRGKQLHTKGKTMKRIFAFGSDEPGDLSVRSGAKIAGHGGAGEL